MLVVRPDADFVTRIGPAPMLVLKPRFDAVIRTGPKLFDLRYLKPNYAPRKYAHEKPIFSIRAILGRCEARGHRFHGSSAMRRGSPS